jgi:hypothetical protein
MCEWVIVRRTDVISSVNHYLSVPMCKVPRLVCGGARFHRRSRFSLHFVINLMNNISIVWMAGMPRVDARIGGVHGRPHVGSAVGGDCDGQ